MVVRLIELSDYLDEYSIGSPLVSWNRCYKAKFLAVGELYETYHSACILSA